MISRKIAIPVLLCLGLLYSCGTEETVETGSIDRKVPNKQQVDRFADIQVLRYDIVGFDQLSLDQKK